MRGAKRGVNRVRGERKPNEDSCLYFVLACVCVSVTRTRVTLNVLQTKPRDSCTANTSLHVTQRAAAMHVG